jgi:hypothetical protein
VTRDDGDMKRRWLVYGLAAAAGIALALPSAREHADSAVTPHSSTRPVREPPAAATRTVAVEVSQPRANAPPAPIVARLYASSGLEFEPLHANDVFVGYAVVRSHDPRLAVGDVVIAVGGEPVEEGAAGSELLIAALRNAAAELTVQQRSDWQPSTD